MAAILAELQIEKNLTPAQVWEGLTVSGSLPCIFYIIYMWNHEFNVQNPGLVFFQFFDISRVDR